MCLWQVIVRVTEGGVGVVADGASTAAGSVDGGGDVPAAVVSSSGGGGFGVAEATDVGSVSDVSGGDSEGEGARGGGGSSS